MLQRLMHYKDILSNDIGSLEEWHSLYIDYENPIVERLWKQDGEYRICLHKIHPSQNDTFFHSHPWPSAMHLLAGTYFMGVGKSNAIGIMPPIDEILELKAGDSYEMLTELDWHYIQPKDEYCYSIMLIGAPFNPDFGKTHSHLQALDDEKKLSLLLEFREILSME